MFKKTLAAVAVLGAFAGSAVAANVTLYGVVDEALNYTYLKGQGEGYSYTNQAYGMKNGVTAGSRWGVKGQEELGNGYTVGFQLESGFDADTGKMGQGNRLFGRVSSLYVTGPFGTLAAGRDGALDSGLGTVSYLYQYSAFGTGWNTVSAAGLFKFGYADRADNTLTYVTPDLGGVKLYAQYSFAADGQEKVSSNDNNRYAALGAQYKAGAFSTGLVVDMLKKAEGDGEDLDDQFKVSYGASYDFGVAKVMGMAQYTKHMAAFGSNAALVDPEGETFKLATGDLEGYNFNLGTIVPVAGGNLFAQVNYVHVKDKAAEEGVSNKGDGYGLGLGYQYALSKRTSVYTYGGYSYYKAKPNNEKLKLGEVGLGLVHKF